MYILVLILCLNFVKALLSRFWIELHLYLNKATTRLSLEQLGHSFDSPSSRVKTISVEASSRLALLISYETITVKLYGITLCCFACKCNVLPGTRYIFKQENCSKFNEFLGFLWKARLSVRRGV